MEYYYPTMQQPLAGGAKVDTKWMVIGGIAAAIAVVYIVRHLRKKTPAATPGKSVKIQTSPQVIPRAATTTQTDVASRMAVARRQHLISGVSSKQRQVKRGLRATATGIAFRPRNDVIPEGMSPAKFFPKCDPSTAQTINERLACKSYDEYARANARGRGGALRPMSSRAGLIGVGDSNLPDRFDASGVREQIRRAGGNKEQIFNGLGSVPQEIYDL